MALPVLGRPENAFDPGSVRELSKNQTLTEKEYRDLREKYEDDFEASMGL